MSFPPWEYFAIIIKMFLRVHTSSILLTQKRSFHFNPEHGRYLHFSITSCSYDSELKLKPQNNIERVWARPEMLLGRQGHDFLF